MQILIQKWIKNGKEKLPDCRTEEAFAHCLRTPIAQSGSNVALQQKASIDFSQELLISQKCFSLVFYCNDSLFLYLCYGTF